MLKEFDRLTNLRSQIDKVDEQIVALLNQRAGIVQKIGKVKQSQAEEFYVPEREKEVYDRLLQINPGPFPNEALKDVFREIMRGS